MLGLSVTSNYQTGCGGWGKYYIATAGSGKWAMLKDETVEHFAYVSCESWTGRNVFMRTTQPLDYLPGDKHVRLHFIWWLDIVELHDVTGDADQCVYFQFWTHTYDGNHWTDVMEWEGSAHTITSDTGGEITTGWSSQELGVGAGSALDYAELKVYYRSGSEVVRDGPPYDNWAYIRGELTIYNDYVECHDF